MQFSFGRDYNCSLMFIREQALIYLISQSYMKLFMSNISIEKFTFIKLHCWGNIFSSINPSERNISPTPTALGTYVCSLFRKKL